VKGVFLFERNFGHGELQLGKPEERIVAEAAVTTRRGEDFAIDGTFGGQKQLTVARYGQGATIAGCALRDSAQARKQIEIVAFIVGEPRFGEARLVTGVTSKARGTHPGFATQGVDFKTGVVSEDEAGSEAAVVLRFHSRVPGKGGFVLVGWRNLFEVGRRLDRESPLGGGDRKIAQLTGVGGGSIESNRHRFILCGGIGRCAFFRSKARGQPSQRGMRPQCILPTWTTSAWNSL
jgi:hypothetical protein